MEQVILFCVELPNKKTIGVKAKNNKICADILKPVLNKYGYKIDQVTMIVVSILLYIIYWVVIDEEVHLVCVYFFPFPFSKSRKIHKNHY